MMQPTRSSVRTVIYDATGKPVLVLEEGEKVIQQPDGSLDVNKVRHVQALVDGAVHYAGGGGSEIGGVCDLCRNPPPGLFAIPEPSVGVVSKEAGRRCDACGVYTCPRHRTVQPDGRCLCGRCVNPPVTLSRILGLVFQGLHTICFRRVR